MQRRTATMIATMIATMVATATTLGTSAARACELNTDNAGASAQPSACPEESFDPGAAAVALRVSLSDRWVSADAGDDGLRGRSSVAAVGVTAHMRVSSTVAIDTGFDFGVGKSPTHGSRYEVDARWADILLYLDGKSRAQPYVVMSFLMDTAILTHGEGTASFDTNTVFFLGGAVGGGVEYRSSISRGYAIDARAFSRAGSSNGSVLETGVLLTASYLVF